MNDYTTDSNFQIAILVVLRHEGGYVNDPNDSGGETKYGISKRTYPSLDIKNLTVDQASQIYYRDWWTRFKYGQITNLGIAQKILDTSINLGAGRAHKLIQQCLQVNGFPNIVNDGNLGPISLAAINKCDPTTLLASFRQAQATYYKAIVSAHPEDQKFLKGWLIRAQE